jgi:flagellar protein FliO/FliZ
MLKWLRGGTAPSRVGVIESLPIDGKRSVILVCRDNIEHLVMVGGRNNVVIEPNIMHQPAPKPGRRPAPEWKGLPPASAPTREPPPQSPQHGLGELTRRLEAELRGSPPLRSRSSPTARNEPRSSAQAGPMSFGPRYKPFDAEAEPRRADDPGRNSTAEAVPDETAEKNSPR